MEREAKRRTGETRRNSRRAIKRVIDIKRLNPYIIDEEDFEWFMETFEEEVSPIFGKPGRYYNRYFKIVWQEIYDDTKKLRAFREKSTGSFLHELRVLNHKPLTVEEEKSLDTLLFYRNFPGWRKLRELKHIDWHWKELREIKRTTWVWFQKEIANRVRENEATSNF
jgi:hypothetical protein